MPEKISFFKEIITSLFIVGGAFVLSKVLQIFLARYLKKIAQKTKTDIDDVLLQIFTKPLYIFILLLGLYFGLISLSSLKAHSQLLTKIFKVIFIFLFAYVLAKTISFLIIRWLKVEKKFEKTPRIIGVFLSFVIYLIAFLIILDTLGIKITPLLTTLGIGGLAIGLALQSTLSDFFAGLHLISDRPIRTGDFIELEGGISGFVEDIGWRSTKIRTLPNTIVVVPNSKIAQSIITNLSAPEEEMSVVIQCGVSYTSDLEKVEKVTIDVAKEIQKNIEGAVKDFEPFVRYHTFGDSNINFSIILRVKKPVYKWIVVHEFIKALKKRYDKEGIEISWPVRKVYLEKGK